MILKYRWPFQRKIDECFGTPTDAATIAAYGASIENKQERSLRVGTQNSNGTYIGQLSNGMEEVDAMSALGLDILGITETKLNPSHEDKMNLTQMIRLEFGYGTSVTSSVETKKNGYLPGGTATMIQGRATGRVTKLIKDTLGRFSGMALQGKDGCGLVVFTLYRVCQKRGVRTGPNTAHMQQCEGLRERGIKNPDPRNQVFEDISKIIGEWKGKGYHPIVMGDLNTVSDDPELVRFMEVNGLVDLIRDSNDGTPPATFSRSNNRLDYILGDQHTRRAVLQSGALGLHEGIVSDHTMQWVDFDTSLLFQNEWYDPTSPCERQFTMRNVKKKHAFQAKLREIHDHQRIGERVLELADDFKTAMTHDLEDVEMIALVARYQRLDTEIQMSIKAAENSVGRKNFGYQRSSALVNAGAAVLLWKAVFSCINRKTKFTERVRKLAEKLLIPSNEYTNLDHKQARMKMSDARKCKRAVNKNDGEERAKWLEGIAQAAALDKPDRDWQAILKQMIRAARQRSIQQKLSFVFRPTYSKLDYVEVPSDEWYYSARTNEIYHFDNGLFRAHSEIEDEYFHPSSTLKVLPDDAVVITVSILDDSIEMLPLLVERRPTWKKVTKPEEMEDWFFRRNKAHHQQVHQDGSFPTTEPFAKLIGEHGTSHFVEELLAGKIDIDTLDFPIHVKDWLKTLRKEKVDKELDPLPNYVSPLEFQSAFKEVDEMTSSSPSGLHYTLWKAIAEKEDFTKYLSVMMSLPFMYGFTNKRWETAIEVMLEKKRGVRRIHLMRIIALVEADFNTALKIMYARKLMWQAERSDISSDQWGGAPKPISPRLCYPKAHLLGIRTLHENNAIFIFR